jgi:spore germination protein YaaH
MVAALLLLAAGGWVVPWQRDAGLASVERASGRLSDVLIFAARLDRDGHPVLDGSAEDWSAAIERIHATRARAWLTVVNDRVGGGPTVLKDADVVHRLIGDAGARAAHAAEIVALARSLKVDGVDIDYENLPASERDAITAFARELGDATRAAGLSLSWTVQPKRGESSSRGPGASDWRELCRIADRMQVMLYNEHNAQTGPGPVASPAWAGDVAAYALSVCPADKVVPVLKVSGMDWGPAKADWRSFGEIAALREKVRPKLKRERGSKAPWFAYKGADGRHVVYFEDAASLEAKAKTLRKLGLDEVVLWSLGSEDPETISRLAK